MVTCRKLFIGMLVLFVASAEANVVCVNKQNGTYTIDQWGAPQKPGGGHGVQEPTKPRPPKAFDY